MKNLLNEKPTLELNNRMQQNVDFVANTDLKNKTVLDIGCGFGWCEMNFLKRGIKKIVGIEITEEDLKAAKKNLKDKKVHFTVGSAIDIPFKDNSFDTVVSWEVIEHIPKNTEEEMFREVGRVLKNNGVFYLSTPFDHPISKFLDPAWWLIGHRHYSISKLCKFGKNHGFEVESYIVKGRIWSILSLLNMYFFKWVFRKKPLGQEFLSNKEKQEYLTQGYVNIFVKFRKRS